MNPPNPRPWGQAFGPAAGLLPGAGERKILGQICTPCPDRVPFDVVLHSSAFFVAADQVVVALILPKAPSLQTKHADGFVAGEALQRAEPFSRWYARSHKQMHVIRHDHKSVQFVAPESEFAIRERADYHFGNLRAAQIHRSAFGVIEQAIHRYEGLSGGEVGWPENPAIRKAAVQTESNEYSFAHNVQVRKAAFVPTHFGCIGGPRWFVSGKFEKACAGRKPGDRPEGLPHRQGEP